ncbi:hypothetical protein V8B97DRAFT_1958702 [Scleroderma yunnanense]
MSMDLEEFDLADRDINAEEETLPSSLAVSDALKWMDAEWHAASRRARWMDLIGDYAGQEPFIVDGHSLIQLVIDDPLLALAKPDDPSFQILHAIHILERVLNELIKRSAVFDVVFWDENRYAVLMTGSDRFNVASRSLARRILFNHLRTIPGVQVHAFSDLADPKWIEYRITRKPMFVFINGGDERSLSRDAYDNHRLLCHRTFVFGLLRSGLVLALLQGVQFHGSKVLSFVFEPKMNTRRSGGVLPPPIRAASSVASDELKNIEHTVCPSTHSVLFDPQRQLVAFDPISVLRKITETSNMTQTETDAALLFAFIIHVLLLDRISVQDRARRSESISKDLKKNLTAFLATVLLATETVIADLNTTIDVDARVFISLIRFFAENTELSLQQAIGPDIVRIMQNNFSAFVVPPAKFFQFSKKFRQRSAPSPPTLDLQLLPFSNSVVDEELAPLYGATVHANANVVEEMESSEESDDEAWDASSGDEDEKGTTKPTNDGAQLSKQGTGFFDEGILYRDTHHWHNSGKAILLKHQGGGASAAMTEWQRKRKLRSEQQFMKSLHRLAATITGTFGATLQQVKIPPVGSAPVPSSKHKQVHSRTLPKSGGSKGAPKQSKADIIREQNMAQKTKQRLSESAAWLKQRFVELAAQGSPSVLAKMFSDMERNSRMKEPHIATEVSLYKIHRVFLRWVEDPQKTTLGVRDKNSVAIMKGIKDIQAIGYMTEEIHKCLESALIALGFSDYVDSLTIPPNQENRPLNFSFFKLLKSKTKAPAYAFMSIQEHPVEWQLRVFGEYMDRSMDSQPDPRVSFKPDAWQREVLDAIDKNMSLLAVAPTSAGKTFISFYAMEKVLRSSDEGVIVYVAPSKALVVQVAAEIYARFSKDLKGGSCWAVHTRDYHINEPENCQILVTVPEVLAIMLLSPPLARTWSSRVQYIILDEIHTIGRQEGGSVWEQILLLAPCPIIGLSATVGSPEQFNEWLAMVQKANGFNHKFVHHPHRYSHLRKFFYNIYEEKNAFESLASHQATGRMRFLHPIAMLAFGARSIPSDLALESLDTLTLFQVLKTHGGLSPLDLEKLEPTNFFPQKKFLQQKDVISYDKELKAYLAPMMSSFDPYDSKTHLSRVISGLEDSALSRVPSNVINTPPDRATFKKNLIYLVADLHAQGDLPAILFSFDPSDCEIMARDLMHILQTCEQKWREESPEWQRKLAQYELWLSRAKERERSVARAAANKKDPDEPPTETVEWQESFNPDEPLPAFSFANTRVYSMSTLEEDLRGLTRSPPWALQCLRRGIAVHHPGMNRHYRMLIESLFRRGFIRVMIATETLALGINAPARTSVFCGDSPFLTALMYRQCAGRAGRRGYDLLGKVVFYGLPMDRVQRLTLSGLPSLGVNFPVSPTLVLQLFNLLEGSEHAPMAVKAVQKLFRLPRISLSSKEGKHQLLRHLRFTIDYLRRSRLLDEKGRPFNLSGIVAQLYSTEPSNLALVALLRNGVLHRICCQPSMIQAKRNFILLMSHLFGRRYLPGSYLRNENMAKTIKKFSSIVVLPPLPKDAKRILEEQDREILRIFTCYALTHGSKHENELGPDTRLPLSNKVISGPPMNHGGPTGGFYAFLKETAIQVIVRSLFVANSGHDDHFSDVPDLVCTTRHGLNLDQYAIPSFSDILSPADSRFALNAYVLDFFIGGQVRPLMVANAIRRGDIWFLLQDFTLALLSVRGVLENLIMRKARAAIEEGSDDDSVDGTEDLAELNLSDEEADEGDEEDDIGGKKNIKAWSRGRTQPRGVSEDDWRVLEVVEESLQEFQEKFKAMWA